ncbi:UdgX family uracil-DNA binding protein [Kribbella sandramycini]|uniref:Type-4 uracil-DNA glycosylase n=1 Tax=Kribbella sandramycini TaxID=60450 RepID=A0A7Y4L1X0_9ACTN|nr:UdgX family uracil-DNA binding protein [Kribbella sandramycini]MBB6566549.1 DNA polymerase [Kribbella sandramycini]NOL42794.1 UdgX family uracil-DNA binding protein [Kribbella sandramycini]
MDQFPGANRWVPNSGGLRKLTAALPACHGCDLAEHAEQVVPGEGPARAALMLVGEQPGDVEDKQGHVFAGPAGRLLDKALDAAGIDRSDVFLTNAVKHFRYTTKGKRRIHKTPAVGHITACRPWLERELRIVSPRLVVILGAVAARALIGPGFKVTEHRGERVELPSGRAAMATVHPSAVVRSERFREDFALFVADLQAARDLLGQ